ncbi:SPOR domain-containing protein [Thiohalomonas denitrificans]|uniref:DedD protein n=1 Tax=Thiohalomonas denitrificans TaxID=415747 RepID=A0A1G5QQD2_9GAMM|nr:SPOR domain-containing protein [Thiohalomonas denitrificans]SCZ63740.1 DedD protein [Thiohalomonas denitrificans]
MNPRIKQRLVGAVVLVALAVIFVPMLLDGDDSSMPAFGSNIPPKSGYQFESLDIPPRQPISMEPKAAVVEKEDAAPILTGPVAEVEPEPPLAAEEGEAKTEPEPEPEPGEVKAWAVQVGSFSNSENALRLRDRLRGEDFDAFVEQVKSSGEAIYRVRVGPEASRERAESLMERVKAKQPDLPALVMGHP